MALTKSSLNLSFLPQEIGDLLVRPITDIAAASLASTVVVTGASQYRLPILASDPVSQFVAEGQELSPSDPVFSELAIPFSKLGGLTILSREIAEDSSPEAATLVGEGLARDIATRLDLAFFGNVNTNAGPGIKSISPTVVSAGGGWSNVDPFLEAIFAASDLGVTIDTFVASPADALLLAKIKQATGSNLNLLSPDPTGPLGERVLAGVRLITDPAVTAGEIWGIPRSVSYLVIRDDVKIEQDKSVFFTSDRVAVKATLRVGWGWPQPSAIVKVTKV